MSICRQCGKMADFMRNSAIKGMTSILRADMKYTRLFAKIAFKSIPAKSIPVTIMLAGPIIFPTLEMVFVMSSGSRILVKNKMAPMAMEIILMLRMIFSSHRKIHGL